MQLPQITIPFDLPFDLPLLLHPAVVHFVVVIPVIILILELGNLLFKRRALSVTSLIIMSIGIAIYIAAYFTGKTDSKEVFDLLDPAVQEQLKSHTQQGIILIYAFIALFLLKILTMLLKKNFLRALLILAVVAFLSFLFKQGLDGSKLVYEHGVGVEAVVGESRELEQTKSLLQKSQSDLLEAQGALKSAHGDTSAQIERLKKDVDALKSVILLFQKDSTILKQEERDVLDSNPITVESVTTPITQETVVVEPILQETIPQIQLSLERNDTE